MKKSARILAACGLLAVSAGPVWNLIVVKVQQAQNPVPGVLHSIDGLQMHLYCTGAGSPAVVIEAGLGATWLDWQTVQPPLSALTRTCTYDRSGLGWSEPRPGPRDAEAIARQLHALLEQEGVSPPLVLLGHSAGGLYVREYARQYPAQVAGVALVDSASPRQLDEIPGWRKKYDEDRREAASEARLQKLLVWSGLMRWMGHCSESPGKDRESLGALYRSQLCRPGYVAGDDGEFIDFEAAAGQAARLTTFGQVPLLILSKDPAWRRPGMTEEAIAGLPVWQREQEELKALSPLSWRVVARGASHRVHRDRPELVVEEVTRLVEFLRGRAAPPFGSTAVK